MKLYLLFLLPILVIALLGCGSNAEKTYTLTVKFAYKDPSIKNCTNYLASNFIINIYNSDMEKYATYDNISCTETTSSKEIQIAKGSYYITVELKDSKQNTKTFGSAKVDIQGSQTTDIILEEYTGGISFTWNSSLCDGNSIEIFKFTIKLDGSYLSANLWGTPIEFNNYPINCMAQQLLLNNIKAGSYEITVNGYRTSQSAKPRTISEIPSFKLLSGQDSPVKLDSYIKIAVSDLVLTWDFDSKSITTCSQAGISTISAFLTPAGDNPVFSSICDEKNKLILMSDLSEGSYDITVNGLASDNTIKFTATDKIDIVKGKVGTSAYKKTVLIKEK